MTEEFDELQRAALKQYDNGEFLYLLDESGPIDKRLDNSKDGLLIFIMRELADADGDVAEAIRMMESAAKQLTALADTLTEMEE